MAKRKGQTSGSGKGKQTYWLSTPSGELTEKEFEDELVRRIEEIESGKVKTIPWDVVWQRLAAKARRPRGDH